MEFSLIALTVLQSMGISLGVGASTMTVVFFFSAIKDGIISVEERNYLGLAYIVLRVAMAIILTTSISLSVIGYILHGDMYFTAYVAAQAILTTVLFVNAFLMTIKVMPSTFGPAIQASSWYTLGFMSALYGQDIENVNMFIFLFAYGTVIFFAISFINAMMAYLKEKREEQAS
jgi:hypothetical protein